MITAKNEMGLTSSGGAPLGLGVGLGYARRLLLETNTCRLLPLSFSTLDVRESALLADIEHSSGRALLLVFDLLETLLGLALA